VRQDTIDHVVLNSLGRPVIFPVGYGDIPMHVSIAVGSQSSKDPRIIRPLTERAAEPGSGIDADNIADTGLGLVDIGAESQVGESRHGRVGVRMISNEMASASDRPGEVRIGGRPPALDKEARPHAVCTECGYDRFSRDGWTLPPARMLGIKRQRDTPVTHGW